MVSIGAVVRKMYTYRFLLWIYKILRKDKILITYNIDPKTMRFTEQLTIAHVSMAQAYGMGYIKGVKIKDELKYMPFKTFVRFTPDQQPPFPVIIMDDDGKMHENFETSSTLYDHWKSDAQAQFIKGITKTVLTGGDGKILIMILGIVAVACVGMYFIFFR